MNVDRLRIIQKKLRDIQPEDGYQFDMGDYCTQKVDSKDFSCTTVCCMAGWAVHLFGEAKILPVNPSNWSAAGRNLLDLTPEQSSALFFPYRWPDRFGGWEATSEQGADFIDYFIDHGGYIGEGND